MLEMNPAPGHEERSIQPHGEFHGGVPHAETAPLVLLVFPDVDTSNLLARAFRFLDVSANSARSASEALAWTLTARPSLVVMDLNQPDADGLVLCADLRAKLGPATPIIVCGDAELRRDSLLAFRLGADDFVSKPFDVDDLVARGEAALRRSSSATSPAPRPPALRTLGRERTDFAGRERGEHPRGSPAVAPVPPAQHSERVDHLELDHTHHRVLVGGQEVRLSRSEFLLLGALMGRSGELLSRLDLARAVWGAQLASVGRPIDQHMYRLRSKLQSAAHAAGVPVPVIASVPGFGYRLVTSGEPLREAC